MAGRVANPFVYGEIVSEEQFVNREEELRLLTRDLLDSQKIFLLSPRRFGKSSLVAVAFLKLRKQHVRTAVVSVSSYASYSQFLEKFAEKVLRSAGPWDRVRDWVQQAWRRLKPVLNASVDPITGEINISLGRNASEDPVRYAADVFALPGELSRNADFRMAVCLDEFQQITQFNGIEVEAVLRDAIQRQRKVGYVFSGSQPALMEAMLVQGRPFHKSGPVVFLEKIKAESWKGFIESQFRRRGRSVSAQSLDRLLELADLIPYDIQRIAHELWDHAEVENKLKLDVADVDLVVSRLVAGYAPYFERLWEQLTGRQRAVLQALASRGPKELLSQAVRETFRLGPASSVQKAIQSLDDQDLLDRYHGEYFIVDPIFAAWIRASLVS